MYRYGISMASMLTLNYLSLGKNHGLPSLAEIMVFARVFDFDFVQGLPIRGTDPGELSTYSDEDKAPVRYYEGAWNAVPGLMHALRQEPGTEGTPSNWLDWYLFPNAAECYRIEEEFNRIGARKIGHDMIGPGCRLTEIHSGLKLFPENIRDLCEQTGQRLVLDTTHLVDQKHSQCLGNDWVEWKHTVMTLSPYIDVIHVHPVDGEFAAFLRGDSTLTERIIGWALKYTGGRDLDLIAEYNPGFAGFGISLVSPFVNANLAHKMLKAIRRVTMYKCQE